jgi:hypothetical protein
MLSGARRQLLRIDRVILPDIAGPDRLNHQVAQCHRRAHSGKHEILRSSRIRRIDPRNTRPVGALVHRYIRIDANRRIIHAMLPELLRGTLASLDPCRLEANGQPVVTFIISSAARPMTA